MASIHWTARVVTCLMPVFAATAPVNHHRSIIPLVLRASVPFAPYLANCAAFMCMRKSVRLGKALETVLCDNLVRVRVCVCVGSGTGRVNDLSWGQEKLADNSSLTSLFSPPEPSWLMLHTGWSLWVNLRCSHRTLFSLNIFPSQSERKKKVRVLEAWVGMSWVGMLPERRSFLALVKTLVNFEFYVVNNYMIIALPIFSKS